MTVVDAVKFRIYPNDFKELIWNESFQLKNLPIATRQWNEAMK